MNTLQILEKNNNPQDMFLACVWTEEISRIGMTNSLTSAVLLRDVNHSHKQIRLVSELVGARLPAPPSDS